MILNRTKKNPLSDKKKVPCGAKKEVRDVYDFKLDKKNPVLDKEGLRGLRGFHTRFLLFTTLISDV